MTGTTLARRVERPGYTRALVGLVHGGARPGRGGRGDRADLCLGTGTQRSRGDGRGPGAGARRSLLGGGRDARTGDRGALRGVRPDRAPPRGIPPLALLRRRAGGCRRAHHRLRHDRHCHGRPRCVRSRQPRRPARLPALARPQRPAAERQRVPCPGGGAEPDAARRHRGPGRPLRRQPRPARRARARLPRRRCRLRPGHRGIPGGRPRARPGGRPPPRCRPRRPGGGNRPPRHRRPRGSRPPVRAPRQGPYLAPGPPATPGPVPLRCCRGRCAG